MRMFIATVSASFWIVQSYRTMAGYFYKETCDDKAGIAKNSGLFIAAYHIIAVHKDTRRKEFNFWGAEYNELFVEGKTVKTWNFTKFNEFHNEQYDDFEMVVGFLVVRTDTKRKNDNPVVFEHRNYTYNKSEPGTGDDFSSMYYGSTFRPGRIEIKLFEDDKLTKYERTFLDYTPPEDCYATGSWIANEGFYLLDKTTQEWYPIYYDMWSEDVFIM
ncbi:unnamed protein product [Cylicocyclus nassatus]|uniref:Uncharacterized protein n=1 Tax=Cylicocyclus nassatus TaxID=53992 RepID=A0AA36HCB5_CYLNA|nr:unnamed protein product [Cylicocyclus nassatus]